MIVPSILFAAAASSGVTMAMPLVMQANQTLEWTPCPDLYNYFSKLNNATGSPFDCATLSVPQDYTNKSSKSIDIEVYRVNATKQPVLGNVMFNPGGPGESGGQSLTYTASELRHYIGEQWNIVSWDPRGTGKTMPFNCNFSSAASTSSPSKREISSPQIPLSQVQANLTTRLLNGGWDGPSGAVYQATQCHKAMASTGRFIGTPFTVRDMFAIVDALGGDRMLRYWGTSYGTALGSYAAAMFPERIERMVLDGNIDPSSYQNGTYGDFLSDADNAFQGFLEQCLQNKAKCDFAQYTKANCTDDMLNVVLEQMKVAAANFTKEPNEATWNVLSSVQGTIYSRLYSPSTWPWLGQDLVLALHGKPSAHPSGPSVPWDDAKIGIRASDALFQVQNASAYIPVAEFATNVTKLFASQYEGVWTSAAWQMPAAEQYKGSFTNIKTKHPILYVNGENDPVTPLSNAELASKGFKGSVVLRNSPGYGHGIIAYPSTCVAGKTSRYFKDGTMPDVGQACKSDAGAWAIAANKTLIAGGNTI